MDRSPLGFVSGMILVRLLMIDLWVVRCGRPLDLVAEIQAARSFWVGEVGLSLKILPMRVICLFSICCSTVMMLLKFCLISSFLMWLSLTSCHVIFWIMWMALWWKDSSFDRDDCGVAQLLHPQSRRFIGITM